MTDGRPAWNAAGAWEERGVTMWAKERLADLLTEQQVAVDNVGGAVLALEGLAEVDGDASVACVRGKTKAIFELAFKVKWRVTVSGLAPKTAHSVAMEHHPRVLMVAGTASFADMTGDTCVPETGGYLAPFAQGHVCVATTEGSGSREQRQALVREIVESWGREGLRAVVSRQALLFLEEIKGK